MIKKPNHGNYRNTGSAFIEISVAFLVMIILTGLGLDLTLITLGMFLNDQACRDAARAAAQQNNSASALTAAQTQLKVHATDGIFISQPILVSQTSPNFVYNDYAGSPPANQSSYVTVTTSVNIKIPAPILFGSAVYVAAGNIQFIRRYTYPIIRMKFYG